jgi:hypothetical protein
MGSGVGEGASRGGLEQRSERDLVVGRVVGRVGEVGAVDFEGVVELAGGVEQEVGVRDGAAMGREWLVGRREQLGVLCEQELDHEEDGGVDERERLRDGQGDVKQR